MSFNIDWLDDLNSKNMSNSNPFVTINLKKSKNRFYINAKACEIIRNKLDVEDFKYIKVGIDKEEKIMALKPLLNYQNGCVKVNNGGGSKKNKVKSKTFTNSTLREIIKKIFDMDKDMERFNVRWSEEIKGLLVDLKNSY